MILTTSYQKVTGCIVVYRKVSSGGSIALVHFAFDELPDSVQFH